MVDFGFLLSGGFGKCRQDWLESVTVLRGKKFSLCTRTTSVTLLYLQNVQQQ